jgi:hypothetical protein
LPPVILGLLGFAGASFAGGHWPPTLEKVKCNAGNGSEGCDPGNPGAHNCGGDEVVRDEAANANPGGTNVP